MASSDETTSAAGNKGETTRFPAWLWVSLLTAAVITVAGFLWTNGFTASVAANAASILVSIPVTVVIVQRILDNRRDEQWALVRAQTGKSIEGLAQQAAFDLHAALAQDCRAGIPSPSVLPEGGHAASLRRIATALRAREHEHDSGAAVIRLHNTVKQPLYYFGEMAPRVYATGDSVLAQHFGTLEQNVRAWDRARYLYEDERPEAMWTNAADTAEAIADLTEHAYRLSRPTALK